MTNPSFNQYQNRTSGQLSIDGAIDRHLSSIGYSGLVIVKGVHPGSGFTGVVDIQPMTHQQDSSGDTVEHGIIYGVPYLRIQGGSNAIIIDPQVGDIGFMIVAGRDQSNVVQNRAPAAPGSFRKHSMSDCVYVGGYINDNPQQYIQFTSSGIKIVSQGTVEIQAATTKVSGNLDVGGNVNVNGDVVAGNISLENHVHNDVESGSSTTSKPQ